MVLLHFNKCPSPLVSRRFAKNLSPDKINLSTLKGEGQLTNLELDEEVLQSLLDLPTWLAINRVCCNKAAIRVSEGHCCGLRCVLQWRWVKQPAKTIRLAPIFSPLLALCRALMY